MNFYTYLPLRLGEKMSWIQHRDKHGNKLIAWQNGINRSFEMKSTTIVPVALTFDGVCLYYSNAEPNRPLRLCKLASSTFRDYPEPFNVAIFQDYESTYQVYDYVSAWDHDPNDIFYVLERDLIVIRYNRYLNFVDLAGMRINDVLRVVVYDNQAVFMHSDESFTLYTKARGPNRYLYSCKCYAKIPYFRETTEVRCICEFTDIPQTHLFRVFLGVYHFVVYECARGEYLIKNTTTSRLHRMVDVDEFRDIIRVKDKYYMILAGSNIMGGFEHDAKPIYSKGFGPVQVLELCNTP